MDNLGHTYKLILFGDGGVGKTSLAQRYLTGVFSERNNVTIGVEFYVKDLVVAGASIKLQIWDFGGEERFRFLLPRYCQGANGGLFLYDLTALETLHHLRDWLQVVWASAPALPIIVVGAKVDLVEKRKVVREEATALAKTLKMGGYAEVSAKTGFSVEGVFEAITKIMINRRSGGNSP